MNVEFHGKTKLITFESKTYDLDVIGVLLMNGRGLIVRGSHVIIGLTNPYFYVMFSLVQQSSINAYAPPTHTQKKKKKKELLEGAIYNTIGNKGVSLSSHLGWKPIARNPIPIVPATALTFEMKYIKRFLLHKQVF